jgi:hypothetical protein
VTAMTVHHAITWAHMTALEQGGHDKFLPALGNDDLRFTMASIREAFAPHVAATATLERVRAVIETPWHNAQQVAFERITDALAGQPEAPKAVLYHHIGCDARDGLPCTHECATWVYGQPEVPKGQGTTADALADYMQAATAGWDAKDARIAELERALEAQVAATHNETSGRDAAKARVAEQDREAEVRVAAYERLTAELCELSASVPGMLDRIAAAKSQIAGLERMLDEQQQWTSDAQDKRDAANARADAAERDREATRDHVRRIVTDTRLTNRGKRERLVSYLAGQFNPGIDCDLHSRLENEVLRLEHERDQLAALAAERGRLLYHYTSNAGLCTPEERAVLEACKNATISEDDHGDDDRPCFDLDDAIDVTAAELANRAAKAKRERSTQEDIGPPLEQSKAKRGGT